jgi:Dockerin type I domain
MITDKKFKKISFFLSGFVCLLAVFFIFSFSAKASNLYETYDLINNSAPLQPANHTLHFITAQAIPPGGKIVISLADNGLSIPAAFGYLDMDMAIAGTSSDFFLDRSLDDTAATDTDGVAVDSGLGGKITITLNSTTGIDAHEQVQIKLGTNATFGGAGVNQILNAATAGVYWLDVKTYTPADQIIDNVRTFLVMIEPVAVSTESGKIRSNGLPTGTLTVGTTETIMSLTTNYPAVCSYSVASGTDYYAMPNQFYTSDNVYHTVLLTGLMNAHCYDYYVRCQDILDNTVDNDDYDIYFCVAAAGNGGTGGGTGNGTGSGTGTGSGSGNGNAGGGSGGGAGGGGGPSGGSLKPYPIQNLQQPSVSLSGYAYPGSTISYSQDSQVLGTVIAKPDASFIASIFNLTKGLYTFTLAAKDTDGVLSIAYPTTFWIEENTQTNVANILIPPTIELASSTVALGQNILVSGQSAPKASVIVNLDDQTGKKLIKANRENVSDSGRWNSIFSTNGLDKGIYQLMALTSYTGVGSSSLSEQVQCGVGEKVEQGPCARSDVNKDGKVNLVDFSILLYYWGTANATADLNQDGTVDLVDFSILMYCWTG